MSDKDSKKDKKKINKGDESSKKDGKRRKVSVRKKLFGISCISGNRSPEMDDEENVDGGKSSSSNKNEKFPLTHHSHEIHKIGGEYGSGATNNKVEENKMLNEILGEPDPEAMTIDLFNETEEDSFPEERIKTIVAFIILAICFILNTISLVLTHQREQFKRDPLPDIFLDNVPTVDNALYIGEIFVMISAFSTIILMIFHRYRSIVFRRCFCILGLLYLSRAITMYVTVLPVASYTYHCDPKLNTTTFVGVAERVLKLISGLGLSINGQHTFCGDYIFSGHSVILIMAFLMIQEYTPRSPWHWLLLHWTYWLLSLTGILLVMIARGHYTIDVLVAYYITTRIFWIYHTLANRLELKKFSDDNFISRVWWFRYFLWLEGNVKDVVPRHYSVPFSNTYVDFDKIKESVGEE